MGVRPIGALCIPWWMAKTLSPFEKANPIAELFSGDPF
jgi:hypothetical protein